MRKGSADIVNEKLLRCVYTNSSIKLYEYTPSLCNPLYYGFELMSLFRRARFFIEYLHQQRYLVYYLAVDGNLIGHCVIAPGGRRLKCSTDKDIVIGPYFIDPKYRGRGYAKILIRLALNNCSFDFEYAYDWISKTNISSIRATEANGFQKYDELDVIGMTRKLVKRDAGGGYNVYRLQHNDLVNENNR